MRARAGLLPLRALRITLLQSAVVAVRHCERTRRTLCSTLAPTPKQRLVACAHASTKPCTITPCAGGALSQAAPGKPPTAINMTTLLNATHVPIVRFPSLAPTVLELLKLDNVRGDMVQNISKPLKLSELMPKLPTIPTFAAPSEWANRPGRCAHAAHRLQSPLPATPAIHTTRALPVPPSPPPSPDFGPNTSDEEIESNVTAAARALMLPLVESTMLPSYIAGLRARVADEAVWLQGFVADKARQDKLCGFFTQVRACAAASFLSAASHPAQDQLPARSCSLPCQLLRFTPAGSFTNLAQGGGTRLPGLCAHAQCSLLLPTCPPQYYSNCIVFTANMQKTKIQAIATALDVLTQMEAQLNTDMANKIAAFNVVRARHSVPKGVSACGKQVRVRPVLKRLEPCQAACAASRSHLPQGRLPQLPACTLGVPWVHACPPSRRHPTSGPPRPYQIPSPGVPERAGQ
jgi:hypothetical protein